MGSDVPSFDWPAGVHPAADLFPMMDTVSFAKLVDDIRKNGQADPIVLLPDDRLLDGRNRLAACQQIGRKPEVRVYRGDDPTGHVLSLNVHRRHLSPSQLAMIGAESLPLFEEQAKDRQGTRTDLSTSSPIGEEVELGPSNILAAAAVGVGHSSVDRAARVAREAPELVDKIKAGELSVNAAHEVVRARTTHATLTGAVVADPSPARVGHKLHKIDHSKVVERTVANLRALPDVLDAIPADATFPEERTAEWVSDLSRVIASLGRLKRTLTRSEQP